MVCGQGPSAEGHFITPDVLRGCRRSHRRTRWEWMFYNGGTSYPNQWKIPAYCLKASSGSSEYGKIVV